jgi:PKD repeat protein
MQMTWRIWLALAASAGVFLATGGCPGLGPSSPVTAEIVISATQGAAPLTVTVSADRSSSTNGGTLEYQWDFAGQATATTVTATHTFTRPGMYRISLRVTDEQGATDTAAIDVRVRGQSPTAIATADTTAGVAPLLVHFDGTASFAPDDNIYAYRWNFGDGQTSGKPSPFHQFNTPGTYTVELTVETYGGATASATITITVDPPTSASLQFDGNQVAALPLGRVRSLANWTFEAYFKADSAGGTLVATAEANFQIEILPTYSIIRVGIGGQTYQATAAGLAGSWQHLALVCTADGQLALYLNTTLLGSGTGAPAITTTQLNLGLGFRGKITEVRLWEEARSTAQIAAGYGQRLPDPQGEGSLLGYWPLDEGQGQSLQNLGTSATSGLRGVTNGPEAVDPGWSTDAPF